MFSVGCCLRIWHWHLVLGNVFGVVFGLVLCLALDVGVQHWCLDIGVVFGTECCAFGFWNQQANIRVSRKQEYVCNHNKWFIFNNNLMSSWSEQYNSEVVSTRSYLTWLQLYRYPSPQYSIKGTQSRIYLTWLQLYRYSLTTFQSKASYPAFFYSGCNFTPFPSPLFQYRPCALPCFLSLRICPLFFLSELGPVSFPIDFT